MTPGPAYLFSFGLGLTTLQHATGLLGSQAVAQAYATAGKQVRSMLQMDMTAWVKAGTEPVVGIITDFVSPEFTEFIRSIVGEYAQIPYVLSWVMFPLISFSQHRFFLKIR